MLSESAGVLPSVVVPSDPASAMGVDASDLLFVLSPTNGAGSAELHPPASAQITAKNSVNRKLGMLN
jgi:hypothetical protein